jgi:hypothetical protein
MTYRAAGVLAAALIFAAGASSVLAQTSAAPAPADGSQVAKTSSKYDPNKIICKTEEATGSRLDAKRVCHTRAEWAETNRVTQQAVGDAQAQSYQNTPNIK